MSRLKNNGSRALISTELFISGKTWEPLERMPTWWLDIRRKARLEVGQRLVAWRPEGSIVHDYRAYILGIDGHRFIRAEKFLSDHPDDVTALSAAKLLTDDHDVEVWDGARLVARLSHGEVMSPELAFASLAFLPERSRQETAKTP